GDACPQACFPLLDLRRGVGARRGRIVFRLAVPQNAQLAAPHSPAATLAAVEGEQNSVKPGIDPAGACEAAALASQNEKRLLSQIVGIPRIATHDERGAVDPREVGLRRLFNVNARHGAPPSDWSWSRRGDF